MNLVLKFRPLFLAMLLTLLLPSCGGGGEDYGPDSPPSTTPPKIPNAAPVPAPSSLDCRNGTFLTYENFGAAFMMNYCTSCHNSALDEAHRAGAPAEANYDTSADVLIWRQAIMARVLAVPPTMPPSGHIGAADASAFKEWMNCGAPVGSARLH